MPKIHNKYHATADANAVYVGRPTIWGNPWSHMAHTLAEFKTNTREQAVEKFRDWAYDDAQSEWRLQVKTELKGKDLLCFCAPKICHAEILSEIANED